MSADHPGVLLCMAVELKSPQDTIPALTPEEAGELALLVAQDLHKFDEESAELELLTVGALYDPVEILRPMWPVHLELQNLAARAPRKPSVAKGDEVLAGEGRIIAFGQGEGSLPGALTPDPAFVSGPLKLMPLVLQGDPAVAIRCADTFERKLLETGMASAATALFVQTKFGLNVEHVRYMTAFDLAAMMQMQYSHAGVGFLWPIIEAGLMGRRDLIEVNNPPEPNLQFDGLTVRSPLLAYSDWLAIGHKFNTSEQNYAHFQARRQQLLDLLASHGLTIES